MPLRTMIPDKDLENYWKNLKYDWKKAREQGTIFERLFFNKKVKFIKSKLNLENKKILDLGCGTGVCTFDFAKNNNQVIGLDLSEWAIQRAKKNLQKLNLKNVEFITANAEDLPFNNNTFDIVITTGTIQYLKNPEKVIKEAHRILKPGGKIIVEVPNKIYSFTHKFLTSRNNLNDEPINKSYTKKQLIKLLKDFKPIKIYNFMLITYYGIFEK